MAVTVFRDGERIEIMLTLAERDRAPQADEALPAAGEMMGLAIGPVPELLRRNLGFERVDAGKRSWTSVAASHQPKWQRAFHCDGGDAERN